MKREAKIIVKPRLTVPLAIAAIWAGSAGYPALAQSTQRTFTSATEATGSLFKAVQANDEKAIDHILGGPTDLASSGDEAQDRADRQTFVQKYREMHRLGREAGGSMTLYLGAENWPFPVPLVERKGAWRFDSVAGEGEVLFRRIGDNELTAISSCHAFVADENRDRAHPAMKAAGGFPADLVSKASVKTGGGQRALYHGYYFHVLPGRPNGGFVLIAYPAEYRSSGVMTFVVTDQDVVYEKDLGAHTPAVAGAMTTFHKDASWRDVNE